jgi:mannose-6-phosphate isomerase-like protein (cupin superfamily)
MRFNINLSYLSEIDSDEYLFYQQQLKNEEEKERLKQQQGFNGYKQEIPLNNNTTQKPRNNSKPPIPKLQLGNIKVFENGVKATNMKFATKQFENESFEFKTLEVPIKDVRGEEIPGYTIGQYKIFGDSQTRWSTYNVHALYHVRAGDAYFLMEEDGKPLKVGHYVCVPKETRHSICNKSTYVECIVDLIFPGKIILD